MYVHNFRSHHLVYSCFGTNIQILILIALMGFDKKKGGSK